MSFKRSKNPYRALDIGIGRTSNKLKVEEHGLSHYHAYDKIRWLCHDACHSLNLDENYQKFAKELDKDLPPTNERIRKLAETILDPNWELKEFLHPLDRDNYWIQDYAEYIVGF